MHYGDSQIEADQISGRLRERLQKDFGGLGAGAYAVIPATRKISIKMNILPIGSVELDSALMLIP